MRTVFLPFEEARSIVRGLNLKNSEEWLTYCKSKNKSNNIPSCPYKVNFQFYSNIKLIFTQ